jgi:hypothetical protein
MNQIKNEPIIALANEHPKQSIQLSLCHSISRQEKKQNLVARWLLDENAKLYCQWLLE